MNITLYNTTDDKRKLNKVLTSDITLDCSFYDSCNILSPKILLEYNSSVFSKNYCYIPEFYRYYFIKNATVDAGGRIILECDIDPLYTYRSAISLLNVTVTRNENAGRTFLVDPLWTFSTKRNIDVKVFENTPFNIRDASGQSANFVLVMGGGYGS